MFNKYLVFWHQHRFEHNLSPRYVELDWLRIIAFGMLIFYHTGMLYVPNWEFHFKSQYPNAGVENIMLLFSPWRMGLIWFISGAALRCLLHKQPVGKFLLSRTLRILLPLLVGIGLVVPIQLYAQIQQETGVALSLSEFYLAFFNLSHPLFEQYQAGVWPHVDVNHLWYLRSLWQFTLLVVVVLPFLRSRPVSRCIETFSTLPMVWLYLGLLIPLCVLKLSWPADTFRYPMGFVFLLYGFLLVGQPVLFRRLGQCWHYLVGLFLAGYLITIWGYHSIWLNPSPIQWHIASMDIFYTSQRLLGVITALSLAMRFLTYSHPLLAKVNSFVFPFYIFHQSIIIALAFYFTPLHLGPWLEPLIIALLTFLLCSILCLVLVKIDILKPLFGIKIQGNYSNLQRKIGLALSIVAICPLAVKLLVSWSYMYN